METERERETEGDTGVEGMGKKRGSERWGERDTDFSKRCCNLM